ncbi:MAG: hypothetical protein LH472_15885 [Pyrinomonadaceae bacterium]|nr:hypothetical protein [Pyrinomonadaceae bacterium]
MNERLSRQYQVKKLSRTNLERSGVRYRRPFWLPVIGYYTLAIIASSAFFFFIWIILHEGNEESPMAAAGIGAGFIMGGAIVVREIFLRQARQQYLLTERKLDDTLSYIPLPPGLGGQTNKLSLEKNAEIIKEIKRKSEAARVLSNLSNGHWEVLETCSEYLSVVEKQMETVGVGSPRLAGLRRGREIVGDLHHFHLLAWAEIESRAWSQKAHNYATISEKLNAAQEALGILDSALQFYPSEPRLTESELAIKTFIASIKVSHWIEQAERAAFKGNSKRAVSLYRDALFFLAREDVNADERETIAEKINAEIEKLREIAELEKKQIKIKKGKNKKGNEYSEMSEMQ